MFAKNEDIKKYPNREHALCVLNHRGDVDWMVGWCLIERIGMLGVSPCHYLIMISAPAFKSCKVVKKWMHSMCMGELVYVYIC